MPTLRTAGGVSAAITLTVSLVALAPWPASADPAASASITLAADAQPKPDRPTLEAIKQQAAQRGIPFEQAVADHLSTTAAAQRTAAANQPDGPVDVPDVMIDDMHAAEIEDLRRIAAAEGIGLAEAIDRVAWQDEFEKVAAELAAAFPAEFSGAVKNDDSAWFGFKGDVPAKAVELARTLPVRVDLAAGRGYSEAELAAAGTGAHEAVIGNDTVADASTSYDVRTGAVQVEAQLRGQVADRAAAAADLVPRQALAAGVRVEIALVDRAAEPEDKYIRGGGTLGTCTSGFNLKYITSNTKRHGTAGHCGQSTATRTYANHSGDGGSTSVSRVWAHVGDWGDLAYYTVGSKSPTRTFYYDWNKKRYADSRSGMPSVGTRICHFGKATGASCAKVARRDVSSGGKKHMVVMDKDISAGGDSGGPWYYGGMAYGIHFGKIGGESAFTPAYLYQNRKYDVWTR
ncbi:hypothetical protein ACWGH8_31830 [Nonomuraea muscovyensis]|uniref:Uncharacterized protein n=1 Tax=Nonomuraea muscovyensis TaxID=1124761 RepID=A0A7X0CC33_9ACTN|nr:hypothetical protein [Nonomuraea muscovyensis]MBB6351405.1 hypothetical protein [Nonomuraea muscovyensis]